jgi:hypothetical protein
VNLRGEPNGEPFPANDSEFTAMVRAYAPMSFLLQP